VELGEAWVYLPSLLLYAVLRLQSWCLVGEVEFACLDDVVWVI
jgi:hypothetical protein